MESNLNLGLSQEIRLLAGSEHRAALIPQASLETAKGSLPEAPGQRTQTIAVLVFSCEIEWGSGGQFSNRFIFVVCKFLKELGWFPGGTSGKELACQCKRCKRHGFDSWVMKIPWRRAWQSIPVFLLGESQGQGVQQAPGHRVAKSQTRTEAT